MGMMPDSTTDQSLIKLKLTTAVSVVVAIVFAVWTISSIFWSFQLVEQKAEEQDLIHSTDVKIMSDRADKRYNRLDERIKALEKVGSDQPKKIEE